MIQGRDGNLYGTTSQGGSADGEGTIFKLSLAPVLTSAAKATATVGKAFSYQIRATNEPAGYGGLGLPMGLKVDGKTGLISGTPTASGTRKLTLRAVNSFGMGQAALTLTINAASPPKMTSSGFATAHTGKPYSYRITATNSPASFGVLGLPPGLKVDGKTGVLFGTPTAAGKKTLTLKATNAEGTGMAMLKLTIQPS